MKSNRTDGKHIFRVDKFKVPASAREHFLRRAQTAHQLLRTLAGFVGDFFLEHVGGDGTSTIVTSVVWKTSEPSMPPEQHDQGLGYNPGEVLRRLEIEADMAAYAELQA
jgi:hypothetical protein